MTSTPKLPTSQARHHHVEQQSRGPDLLRGEAGQRKHSDVTGGTGMANGAIEKGHHRQRQGDHDGSRRRGNSCTKLQGRVSGFS